jgi:TolB-like protein/Flp pilus assembly protein TadD
MNQGKDLSGRSMSFLQELRRRKVFRVAALYIIGAWVVLQVADLAFESWDIPSSALRYIWLGAILGFPVMLIFGWRYDITTQGIVRTPPADAGTRIDLSLRRSDFVILALLLVVAVGVIYQLTIQISETRSPELAETIRQDIELNSIAVLPLDNLSGDPEQAYFVSGMQDALIAGLSRIRALKVTSKTSTMRYKDTNESLPRIAAQLGVAKLIEGSIFRVGDRVRITVQLVDAKLDEHIWSEIFENEVKDVLLLQSEVAQAIAQQVKVTITPVEQAQLQSAKSVNPTAYEAYLKGRYHIERFTPQDMMLAAQYFLQAMQLDPDYALAHVGLSQLCGFQAQAGLITPKEARERCMPPTRKALDLDASLPEAHASYAENLTWHQFNWEEAEPAFLRAIDLNPSYTEARMFYSHYLTLMGRGEEGTEQMSLALQLDPLNPFVQGLSGAQLLMIGDFQGAVRVIEDVMASTPGFGFGYFITWQAYHVLGEKDKAIAAAANHFRVTRGDPTGALALEKAYVNGDYPGALLHAAGVLTEHSKTAHVQPMTIGILYEQAGEVEKAIDWFEIAHREYDPDAPYMGVLTHSHAVHSNPRFIKLLRDMKLDYWADKYSQPDE